MKVFKLPDIIESQGGAEYCMGRDALKTHAVYLVYGKVRPGETERKLMPGKGHEEILFVVKGSLNVKKDKMGFTVAEGEAFHLKEEEVFILDNPGQKEAVYIIAGARAEAEARPTEEPVQTAAKED
ncbi:MAG: hypothetical protein HY880_02285 [Deltaproteobacteria bacterium]|nr:hypothetical protein [Deltaproteobacteria bacterium]